MNKLLTAEIRKYVDAEIRRRLEFLINRDTAKLTKMFEELTERAFVEWSSRLVAMCEDANGRRLIIDGNRLTELFDGKKEEQ